MPGGGRNPGRDEEPRSKERSESGSRRDRDRQRERYRHAGDQRHQQYWDDRDPSYLEKRDRDYPGRREDRNPRSSREPHLQRDQPPSYREERSHEGPSVAPDEMSYDESVPSSGLRGCYNFKYIPTSRGLCQIMEIFLNMLIVICAGVSYNTAGGYNDLASLGGLYAYYYGGANAFTGAEATRVKELDVLFYQLKVPAYAATMALGGALMGYACLMLLLGVLRVPYRWPLVLVAEGILDALIGLGYLPALAFYFLKLQDNYSSAVCKEREELYRSKGHMGFGCKLHGADIAGGLFGALGVLAFPFSAFLALRAFKRVREMKKQPPRDFYDF
ncbi:MALD3 protein, partial [Atractosteus spatula]|nr:MALD3 protein [Atractosteus spatula]